MELMQTKMLEISRREEFQKTIHAEEFISSWDEEVEGDRGNKCTCDAEVSKGEDGSVVHYVIVLAVALSCPVSHSSWSMGTNLV